MSIKHFDVFAVVHNSDVTPTAPEPGLERRHGALNEKIHLIEHRTEKGWIGGKHSHPHDQVVYVVSGAVIVECNGERHTLNAGDSFVVRGGLEHQAFTPDGPAKIIDVFTPYREDYV